MYILYMSLMCLHFSLYTLLDSGGTCSSLDGSDCDGTRSKSVAPPATVGCGPTLLFCQAVGAKY